MGQNNVWRKNKMKKICGLWLLLFSLLLVGCSKELDRTEKGHNEEVKWETRSREANINIPIEIVFDTDIAKLKLPPSLGNITYSLLTSLICSPISKKADISYCGVPSEKYLTIAFYSSHFTWWFGHKEKFRLLFNIPAELEKAGIYVKTEIVPQDLVLSCDSKKCVVTNATGTKVINKITVSASLLIDRNKLAAERKRELAEIAEKERKVAIKEKKWQKEIEAKLVEKCISLKQSGFDLDDYSECTENKKVMRQVRRWEQRRKQRRKEEEILFACYMSWAIFNSDMSYRIPYNQVISAQNYFNRNDCGRVIGKKEEELAQQRAEEIMKVARENGWGY